MKFGGSHISAGQKKLQELILYISMKSEGDEGFGKVKLNKLLFFSDFLAYLYHGASITGQNYQALQQGPAPKAMLPVLNAMLELGEVAVREKEYHGLKQQRVFSLRPPDTSIFDPKEIALVDEVVTKHWGQNGADVSEKSHKFIGWALAKQGEAIPYSVVMVGRRDLTINERERGVELEGLARRALKAA
jgi:hypothetical protein